MKNNILTIMKKEFARFFKDKRMVLTTIFMPGILIYVMYTFMGDGMATLYTSEEDYVPQVCAVNLPESFQKVQGLPVDFVTDKTEEQAREVLENGEAGCDLLAVFLREALAAADEGLYLCT